jgi:hypothetical protein
MLDRLALALLLVGLTACFHRELAPGGDPLLAFENACLRGQLLGAAAPACAEMAGAASDRLRITSQTYENGTIAALTLRGTIGPGDGARFDRALRDLAARYPDAHGVISLDSPGGSAEEAESIASVIDTSGITVLVDDGARCTSACTVVFAAARKRLISPTATIGRAGA